MATREVVRVDTLIIGAGLIGSSVAKFLAEKRGGEPDSVRVIDFDLEGTQSSSELNAGGVRATWNQKLNIQLSKYSIDYFAKLGADVGYRACGYLWLHSPERIEAALRARDLQMSEGWPVEAWDVARLQREVPFLDKTDGIAGAVFAPRDGLVNSNLLKNHFRGIARERGVRFDDRTALRASHRDGETIVILAERFEHPLSLEEKLVEFQGLRCGAPRREVEYRVSRVVNCAGAWASEVAKILGYPCPSFAQRRQISLFDCREVDLTPYGMIVDTSGVYFHPEATYGLSGFATPGEPRGVSFDYDGESFFQEYLWPALYERSTAFERLRHLGGWAGLYEVSPDESAILGEAHGGVAAEAPGRYFEAHSFSGHGAMHSPAAGLLLAEKMESGRYETMDAEPLNPNRFERGALLHETLVI